MANRFRRRVRAVAVLSAVLLTLLTILSPLYSCGGRSMAYVVAMKSDLRNVASDPEAQLRPSTGVHLEMSYRDSAHWTARASHGQIEGHCVISAGDEMPACRVEIARRASRATFMNLGVDAWLFVFTLRRRRVPRDRSVHDLEQRATHPIA
jgi:hypothetical protein